ncbi:CYTH and CHAD domain-containing protein [Streptomyces sp. TS71-3]|uniref:CYTH and CHAD domain-containing protein n=1 Tax=Streptomyces sp. TS71-3 TaxID=2733862 RepID=UPI001BB323E0|nr:CYTH and CHAD domain-containing protein [Streptomyces sp. TS71-3]
MTAKTQREIERKYEGPRGAADLPDLSPVAGVASVEDKGLLELDAIYYDTSDQRLAADRIILRRRTGGTDAGWHIKFPVSLAEGIREEIRVPLSAGREAAGPEATASRAEGAGGRAKAGAQAGRGAKAARGAGAARSPRGPDAECEAPAAPPEEIASLVRSRVRDEPLEPVVRLRSARRLIHLLDDTGTLLAEAALDRVRAERLAAPSDAARAGTAEWTETEVELADGAPYEFLDAVEEELRKAGWRPSRSASKLARALEETGAGQPAAAAAERRPAAEPGDTPMPAAAPVLDYLHRQRDTLVDLDPAVRRDLPDSVHRMRVATRRMRSVLRSYRKVLDRTVTAPVGDELKWLAGELGIDRDREVLAERLSTALDGLPPELAPGPVRGRMETWSDERRGDTRGRLAEVLDGERYLRLLDTLDRLLADPPLLPAATRKPEKVLSKAMRRDRGRLTGRLTQALNQPPGSDRDAGLHSARKAAKRLRYTAEAARPVLGSKADKTVTAARRLQSLLGDHQDSVMARATLRELSEEAHGAGENAFAYGLMYGREERQAAQDERNAAEREK